MSSIDVTDGSLAAPSFLAGVSVIVQEYIFDDNELAQRNIRLINNDTVQGIVIPKAAYVLYAQVETASIHIPDPNSIEPEVYRVVDQDGVLTVPISPATKDYYNFAVNKYYKDGGFVTLDFACLTRFLRVKLQIAILPFSLDKNSVVISNFNAPDGPVVSGGGGGGGLGGGLGI